MRYPRNMQGYGGHPPQADWPGGARIAVSLVLNYEEGGENCILHGDAASEGFLSENPRRPALARPAPLEHGERLRIRRPRRLLAPPRPLRLPPGPGHHLRRRLRPRPLPRPGRRHAGSRLGDRLPRPALDRLPQPHPRGRDGRPRGGHPPPHRGHRRSPRAAGTPAAPRSRPSTSSPRPAASTGSPTPTTTTSPTGASMKAASSSSSPTASRPTTCASRPAPSTPPRTSSPTSATPSTSSTPKARPAARR